MTWDTAWAIEGGQTSADVGRLLAWQATNGLTGIAHPLDLRVRALDVPGSQVRVMPGACTVPVRALGKTSQVYVGLNQTEDLINIPSTGSSGARSDLIVARVENPINGEPWQEPDDPINGQYVFTRRYPDVGNTVTNVSQVDAAASAITLARIDIPANTGTITQAMIVDLRGKTTTQPTTPTTPTTPTNPPAGDPPVTTTPMASANQDFYVSRAFDRATVVDDVLPYTQTTYKRWPDVAAWTVHVPSTATEAVVDVRIECEQRPTPGQSTTLGHCWGYARLRMLGTGVDYSVDVEFDRDYYGGGSPTTVSIPVGGTLPVPSNARGRSLTFQIEARMFSDSNTRGRLVIAKGSYLRAHIHFNVRPTSA